MCFFTAKKKKYIFLPIVGLYTISSLPPFCFHPCWKWGLWQGDGWWVMILALSLVFTWWFRASCEFSDNCWNDCCCIDREREKRGGWPRLCNKKRCSHDFPSSQSLTRSRITATSPPHYQLTCYHPAGNLPDMEGRSNNTGNYFTVIGSKTFGG